MNKQLIKGMVIKGHQVASGRCNDKRFPEGTIAMQKPYFLKRGVPLQRFYLGTLNIDISPLTFSIIKPDHHIHNLCWTSALPAENFFFVKCQLLHKRQSYEALLYYPDPATKTDHFQSQNMMEILTERINDIDYGENIELEFDAESIKFE